MIPPEIKCRLPGEGGRRAAPCGRRVRIDADLNLIGKMRQNPLERRNDARRPRPRQSVPRRAPARAYGPRALAERDCGRAAPRPLLRPRLVVPEGPGAG